MIIYFIILLYAQERRTHDRERIIFVRSRWKYRTFRNGRGDTLYEYRVLLKKIRFFFKFISQHNFLLTLTHLIYVIRYNFFKLSIRFVELYKRGLVYRKNPVDKVDETHLLEMCHSTTMLSVAILGMSDVLSIIVNEHVFQRLNEVIFLLSLLVQYGFARYNTVPCLSFFSPNSL